MPRGAALERPSIRAVAIVPARLGSVRLPRKMLLAESGLPLIVHTLQNVRRCAAFQRIVVAADDAEVVAAVARAGGETVMTRVDHVSGTDRVHEAACAIDAASFDVVVNVQGDEPELAPEDLLRLVAVFADRDVEAATLCGRFGDADEARATQTVKVVRDARGNALYFSRSLIPHRADDPSRAYARADADPWLEVVRRHIGVYAFRPSALTAFVATPRGVLERLENLEQLRWLEVGRRMRVVEASNVPLGIDTRADYDAFVERVRSGVRSGPSTTGA
jgi:3-deoxy-manno-octulosonate cytidylyltransferase (CMP-KDO synthetase)